MTRILVINPNTTGSVTDMVLQACRSTSPDTDWDDATGQLGASYIASEVAYALAGHAVLDAFARHYDGHDAVLIACFGDPGLLALREVSPVPVVGLAEASFRAAARYGRFAVVTGGAAWGPMLTRFARMHQLDASLAGIFTVELTGAQIAQTPDLALASLRQACNEAASAGAECIVLGGAALAGLAARLQPDLAVKLLDNVVLGAQAAVEQATAMRGLDKHSKTGLALAVSGVDSRLASFLADN